ncbi:hypothetical protein Nepgr_010972 [Nepenthes gracilis]|uniref:Uncharacterized protein n=1 Tax=Nepenthes gracilis TaxID=150966 RepID=A0AAD3XLJ0_NEPGR|nr:hypothetical protein Nepgr_010972 [Nepenthes gracilis]
MVLPCHLERGDGQCGMLGRPMDHRYGDLTSFVIVVAVPSPFSLPSLAPFFFCLALFKSPAKPYRFPCHGCLIDPCSNTDGRYDHSCRPLCSCFLLLSPLPHGWRLSSSSRVRCEHHSGSSLLRFANEVDMMKIFEFAPWPLVGQPVFPHSLKISPTELMGGVGFARVCVKINAFATLLDLFTLFTVPVHVLEKKLALKFLFHIQVNPLDMINVGYLATLIPTAISLNSSTVSKHSDTAPSLKSNCPSPVDFPGGLHIVLNTSLIWLKAVKTNIHRLSSSSRDISLVASKAKAYHGRCHPELQANPWNVGIWDDEKNFRFICLNALKSKGYFFKQKALLKANVSWLS